MQPDPQPDDTRAADELLHPSYWLVHGLPWPEATATWPKPR